MTSDEKARAKPMPFLPPFSTMAAAVDSRRTFPIVNADSEFSTKILKALVSTFCRAQSRPRRFEPLLAADENLEATHKPGKEASDEFSDEDDSDDGRSSWWLERARRFPTCGAATHSPRDYPKHTASQDMARVRHRSMATRCWGLTTPDAPHRDSCGTKQSGMVDMPLALMCALREMVG